MTWEISAAIAGIIIPFFFIYLGRGFDQPNPIFVFLRVSAYIVALWSVNFVINLGTVIVEASDPTATGTINTLADISLGSFYIALALTVFLVYWYLQETLLGIIKTMRTR